MRIQTAARERWLPEGGVLIEYDAIGSTQDAARFCVMEGRTDVVGVRASYQYAGRGRRGTPWIAAEGACLLITYIVREVDADAPRRVPLAAGVAVAEAIMALTGIEAVLKWPNDLSCHGQKLAGILVETVPALVSQPCAMLVGIGVNANVTMFPEGLDAHATSLTMEGADPVDLERLEQEVRGRLFSACRSDWTSVLQRWRAHDGTSGSTFRAWIDGKELEGTASGLADSGALVLRLADGSVREVLAATSSVRATARSL